ncbi:hypothetical protein IV417_07920 [Alphaproteobacteria bacterium KMM 3653]|uniref:Uncharacterized protein n=1 Tax=Harenicola maris TaxID=2841044 RepID=A0AAP2CNS9_9RHOB|nr:hypothetical protein [Harenicola maris]
MKLIFIALFVLLAGLAALVRFFVVKTVQAESSTTGLYFVTTPQWQNPVRSLNGPFEGGTRLIADENALPLEGVIDLLLRHGHWIALGLLAALLMISAMGAMGRPR